jgi:PEP-CTERM motif
MEGAMPQIRILIFLCILAPHSASATPISVAGFSFAAGEIAFADDVVHVSGPVLDPNTVRRVLVGSDISDSFNTGDSNPTVLEVIFLDNSIVNDPGIDLVIFELSGDKPAGSPDPKEIFDVSVFTGSGFSPFVTVTPIATGFNDPADSTLDVFAVQLDLSSLGVPSGLAIDRIRLGVYNSNQGSKSADLTAVGALNSGAPIPEPSTATLLGSGLLAILVARRRLRLTT